MGLWGRTMGPESVASLYVCLVQPVALSVNRLGSERLYAANSTLERP